MGDEPFCSKCGNKTDGGDAVQSTYTPQTQTVYGERPKPDISNKFSIFGILIGFLVTILLGLLFGLLALAVIGLIVYLATDRSSGNARNFFLFGLVAAIVAFVILVLFLSAFIVLYI